jgi:uncharacterized protein (TIGR03435 family)
VKIKLAMAGLAMAWLAGAQPAVFEVASVKASSASQADGKGQRGMKTSPGTVSMQNVPLKAIVRWAYGVQDYQVEGPAWTERQGFDIFAKAAGPAKDPELQAMMRTLLEDRLKLVVHRETKIKPIYEMTIAKGGHKLKPSATEGESSFAPPKGGGGKMIAHAERTSMAEFAQLLTDPLQCPVIDKTGLKGNFDFTVDLMSYIPLDASGKAAPDKVAVSDRETIVTMAIQQQLGLKLEPKKGPIEIVIIDSAEKIPVEN